MAPYRRTSRSVRKTTTAPRDKAWTAMRVLQQQKGYFTLPEVMTAAGIGKASLLRYLKALRSCGYFTKVGNGDRRNRQADRFRLQRDTGPFRPWAQSDGVVYDRNLGLEFYPYPKKEASDGHR